MTKAKKGKSNRKVGRNAIFCNVYKNSHRREYNKARRLRKHLVKFVNDKVAQAALDRCKVILGTKIGGYYVATNKELV